MNFKVWPRGYRQIAALDFVRDRRQLLTVNIAALAVMVVMSVAGLALYPFAPTWEFLKTHWWAWPALAGMLLAYIPLHELTHGLLMHALSGVKPRYGFQLCYAYAGSRACFDKLSHGLIALAPMALWGIVLFVLERTLPEGWFWLLYIVQITNISGSMGDVCAVLYVSRMPRNIVIQDTGTRMRILAPRPENEEPK